MSDLHHKIRLDPASIAHADPSDKTNQVLQPREVLLPVSDGSDNITFVRAQVLSSATYHAPFSVLSASALTTLLASVTDWSGITLTGATLDSTCTGPWWIRGNTLPSQAYGAVIGNSAQATSIHLDNETLISGAHCRYDWNTGILYNAADNPTLNHLLSTLLGIWIGDDATDITPGTHASGALQLAGGVSIAKRVQIESTETGSGPGNTGALRVAGGATFLRRIEIGTTPGQYIALNDPLFAADFFNGTWRATLCNGAYAIEATIGSINCNVSGAYCHNTNVGATETIRTLRIPLDDGTVLEAKLRGGILCAT